MGRSAPLVDELARSFYPGDVTEHVHENVTVFSADLTFADGHRLPDFLQELRLVPPFARIGADVGAAPDV
jgi:hypothetical protein